MNILIISFSVNGAMGDNFKHIVRLLLKGQVSLKVLTNEHINFENADVCNVRFDRKKAFDFVNPFSYYRIWKYIRSANYDKILFLSPHPINILIHKWIKLEKTFYYLHDNEPHSGVSKLDLFFLKKQLDLIYKSSCRIIASSDTMKNDILSNRTYVDRDRISVIYLSSLQNLQYEFDIDIPETIDVLFFGRLEYYKGLDILIKADSYTKQKYSYTLVSKGDLNATFNITTLPHNFNHINEYVSDYDLAKYINSAKLVIMPYRDATGTQVIQTVFYYGKPIIATNVGCFSEYITDGVDGIIVPKEDARQLAASLDRLLSDKELRSELGLNGRKKLETIFSNEEITNSYIKLFNR